jgi:hypothetical protein
MARLESREKISINVMEWREDPIAPRNHGCCTREYIWHAYFRINEEPYLVSSVPNPVFDHSNFRSINNKAVMYPTTCWSELWDLLCSDRLLKLRPE